MYIYHDEDAELGQLHGKRIAVIGYGNQGRAQALNLRDSGLDVLIGNRDDEYAPVALEDGFEVIPIDHAAACADVVMMLIPDEVMPDVFAQDIAPNLKAGNTVVFASGYTITFEFIEPPSHVDVVLVAPRMIGAGVRDLYVAGRGFPAFIAIAQDHSGHAKATVLAIAKGIGATRMGVVEVTFPQETELDLFTEQCFGPAFGHVLTTAIEILIEAGYPPEAVLLELYMSGEFAYTLGKIAEMGMVEQSALHSPASQYGSMSRGMRFIQPEIGQKMRQGLEEIRSGKFAEEWTAEQNAGYPTLTALRETARSLPLYQMEYELRQKLRDTSTGQGLEPQSRNDTVPQTQKSSKLSLTQRWRQRRQDKNKISSITEPLEQAHIRNVLRTFLNSAVEDTALQIFAQNRQLTTHYILNDSDIEFHMRFDNGTVSGDLGAPSSPAEVCLITTSDVLDGMFTGRINAMRAAMTGKLTFKGEAKVALSIQAIQNDLCRLYMHAREKT